MNRRLAFALAVLVPFAAYSVLVSVEHGYTGFLTLALAEPWAMQMLLDLAIACFLVSTWIVRDARERGLAAWPWLVLLVTLGSIGSLGYLVYRELASRAHGSAPVRAASGV